MVVQGRWGSWCGVEAQVAPVAVVVAQVAPVAEVVAQVAPVAEVVAQVAPVAEVVAQVEPVDVSSTVVGAEVVVVPGRSCRCRCRNHSHRVRLGPGCGTAWSSTSYYCIVKFRQIGIVRDKTGTLGRGSWSSQGGPMRIVGGWLGGTC